MPWKFKLHMNDVINEKLIQHDIAYLEHTENKGVMTAFKNHVALKESKNPSWVLSCYDCLWEIEEFTQKEGGGPDRYIFRHLMSGMTLSFVEKKEGEAGISGTKPIVPMLT